MLENSPPGRSPRPFMPPARVHRNASVPFFDEDLPTTTVPSGLIPNGSLAYSPPGSSPRPTRPPPSVQTHASEPRSVVPVPAIVLPSALTPAAAPPPKETTLPSTQRAASSPVDEDPQPASTEPSADIARTWLSVPPPSRSRRTTQPFSAVQRAAWSEPLEIFPAMTLP